MSETREPSLEVSSSPPLVDMIIRNSTREEELPPPPPSTTHDPILTSNIPSKKNKRESEGEEDYESPLDSSRTGVGGEGSPLTDLLSTGTESLVLEQAIFSGFLKKKGERRRVSCLFSLSCSSRHILF
jgi:hypothetical protein